MYVKNLTRFVKMGIAGCAGLLIAGIALNESQRPAPHAQGALGAPGFVGQDYYPPEYWRSQPQNGWSPIDGWRKADRNARKSGKPGYFYDQKERAAMDHLVGTLAK